MLIHGHSSSRDGKTVSYGPDIQPDLATGQMSGNYVKVEDYEKWKKANDTALKERMRRSFIAGVLFGIFLLVAIIMAGVSLQQSAKNTEEIQTILTTLQPYNLTTLKRN